MSVPSEDFSPRERASAVFAQEKRRYERDTVMEITRNVDIGAWWPQAVVSKYQKPMHTTEYQPASTRGRRAAPKTNSDKANATPQGLTYHELTLLGAY